VITHKKITVSPTIQADGNFLGRFFRIENYRQKHRQNFSLPRASFGNS
jgi:hypothetical protein